MTAHMTRTFRRDRLTWVAYVVLAWFAYLQAAPGLVIVHLREELDLSYSMGGLHVGAFAAGSTVAGVISARLERALGRGTLFWSAAALMGAGAIAAEQERGTLEHLLAQPLSRRALLLGKHAGLLLALTAATIATNADPPDPIPDFAGTSDSHDSSIPSGSCSP